jgi:nitroimidazol reductase NimA-like FMN-containing flavoprotein (pyridoxamine 5'-phosphate oxidase superfamily)
VSTAERPMRRSEYEVTDDTVIKRILGRATICRVAMADDHEPYLIPMNCGWNGHRLILHSALEGRKLDILRANPRVCVEIEEDVRLITGPTGEECTAAYVTVIGTGTAIFVTNPLAKADGLNTIVRQCHPGSPNECLAESVLARVVVLEIQFDRLTCKAKGATPQP